MPFRCFIAAAAAEATVYVVQNTRSRNMRQALIALKEARRKTSRLLGWRKRCNCTGRSFALLCSPVLRYSHLTQKGAPLYLHKNRKYLVCPICHRVPGLLLADGCWCSPNLSACVSWSAMDPIARTTAGSPLRNVCSRLCSIKRRQSLAH